MDTSGRELVLGDCICLESWPFLQLNCVAAGSEGLAGWFKAVGTLVVAVFTVALLLITPHTDFMPHNCPSLSSCCAASLF
jgi:uncharacterized membrane-anchored protein YjiN (DUF445 family)